ncbi:hypothetical protein IW261DRAFT_194150 [Armillaria novae-zelandiae]|uniref:F-box domain-containing protein n=1 Tax=Armillaria novae-zelandiae TaxID=153914 RepID=A0AA39P796_9AGAR|nr:hypothetical protein IW261DRAFT_194150 [Armillaria novae-zelandiae]
MDSHVLSSEETVLYNQDLLGAICDDLCSIGIQSSADGTKVNPLVALATVCTSVSETALDRLWKHIYGLNPLLRILNVGSSGPNSEGIWTIPSDVPESIWNRFKLYAQRIRSLTLDASSRAKDHPSIYLRIMTQLPNTPLFTNLKRLQVDQSFASKPHILFLLSSPDLREVGITLDPKPDTDAAATAVRTAVAGRETFIISCSLATGPDHHTTLGRIDLACPAPFFTGKDLRCLKITSHPITYSFLEDLSVSESLEHLEIIYTPGTLPRDSQDGFSSLKTLHVTGPVTSVTRMLRLIVADILQSLTFIDNSPNWNYHNAGEVMHDFHLELVGRFNLSLHELSLTYPRREIANQEHWESESQSVFELLYATELLKTLHYSGYLAFDQGTIEKKLVRAWPNIETISIPRLVIPLPCDVLPVLAAGCSRLASLTIPIEFPESGALPPRQVCRHGLRIFSSPNMPVKNPVRVAGYLDSLFPYLTKADGGDRWDEVECILLDACQLVRGDERRRGRLTELLA